MIFLLLINCPLSNILLLPGDMRFWSLFGVQNLYYLFSNRALVANIFLGLRLPHLDTEFGVYFMIAFCVGLLPVVVLEIYLLRGKTQQGKM